MHLALGIQPFAIICEFAISAIIADMNHHHDVMVVHSSCLYHQVTLTETKVITDFPFGPFTDGHVSALNGWVLGSRAIIMFLSQKLRTEVGSSGCDSKFVAKV